jgi:hypothetical protein
LLLVDELDPAGRRVLLSHRLDLGPAGHALLRRWDQRQPHLHDGAVPVTEGAWLELEVGVQVQFASEGTYRTGDYWLIPARTLTADIEWPVDAAGRPLLLPPMGEPAHYAPLARVTGPRQITELRRTFPAPSDARPVVAGCVYGVAEWSGSWNRSPRVCPRQLRPLSRSLSKLHAKSCTFRLSRSGCLPMWRPDQLWQSERRSRSRVPVLGDDDLISWSKHSRRGERSYSR